MEGQVYEFDEKQNAMIKKLVNQMTIIAIFALLVGAIITFGGIKFLISGGDNFIYGLFSLVGAMVAIVMGIVTLRSASSFRKVITTEGNDIENLMSALDKLTTWFSIITMMAIIIIGILVLLTIVRFTSGS